MTSDIRKNIAQLRLPIVAAPMFLISGPELVLAAAEAGIIGAFPTLNCRTATELKGWLDTIEQRSADMRGMWAVNIVTHRTNSRLADDLALVARHRPPIVITALGSPTPVLQVVHDYGGIVLADVVNLDLARKATTAGADGLVCISAGAGGHTGYLSPFAFVSAVRAEFDGLICVGGGISDGFAAAGAIAAGADLVYMGTRFLVCEESRAVSDYKQMVIESACDDLLVSSAVTGTNASWLIPSLRRNGYDPTDMSKPAARDYGGDAMRWKDIWAAGQGLGAIQSAESLAYIVDRLENDFRLAQARLSRVAVATGAASA